MNDFQDTHLHPLEKARVLESRFRFLVQNPRKIFKKYIQPDMTVLDLGFGTGFFTLEILKLLNHKGKVVAADVQNGMLHTTCGIKHWGLGGYSSILPRIKFGVTGQESSPQSPTISYRQPLPL